VEHFVFFIVGFDFFFVDDGFIDVGDQGFLIQDWLAFFILQLFNIALVLGSLFPSFHGFNELLFERIEIGKRKVFLGLGLINPESFHFVSFLSDFSMVLTDLFLDLVLFAQAQTLTGLSSL
jgi:hypothetical protein